MISLFKSSTWQMRNDKEFLLHENVGTFEQYKGKKIRG